MQKGPKAHLHQAIAADYTSEVEWFSIGAKNWGNDTILLSADTEILAHPFPRLLQQKARLNPALFLPMIFEDLAKGNTVWLAFLHNYFAANPVKPEHRGMVMKMLQDWLGWWAENRQDFC